MCDAIEWNRSVSVRTFIYRLQTISFSWVIHVSGIFLAKFFAGDIFKLFGIVFRFPSMLLWSILVQQFLKELWANFCLFSLFAAMNEIRLGVSSLHTCISKQNI